MVILLTTGLFETDLILVLGLLVLDKELQAFFPYLRLNMTATAVAFLSLFPIRFGAFVLGVIRLANHFRFAV